MITLHHLNHSRSMRILWLLEELNVEYNVVTHERDPKTHLAPQSMRDISPLGRSPIVVIENDGHKTVLSESGAIVTYLVEHYNGEHLTLKKDDTQFADYIHWLHFSEGSMMPPLIAKLIMGKAKAKKKPFVISTIADKIIDAIMDAYYNPNANQNLNYVAKHLQQKQHKHDYYFVGSTLTLADIMMLFPLEAIVATQRDAVPQAIRGYVDSMHARPAYKRALEQAGEYQFGPSKAA